LALVRSAEERSIDWVPSIPFFVIHAIAFAGLFYFPFTWEAAALVASFYVVRMFGVTAGYHRLFGHRSFEVGRGMQLFFAVLAMTSVQKGVLWWASHHRVHHKRSDLEGDIHSAKLDGFWWSHVGWILSKRYERTELDKIKDFASYPELRWLDRHPLVPPVALSLLTYALGGFDALYWAMGVGTVLVWHGTFTINSFTHLFGRRRYATSDDSRNSLLFALITLGEGWHNNHHYYQRSCSQGFYWWEIDITYYVLRAMQAVGLVRKIHVVPEHVREKGRVESAPAATPTAAEATASARRSVRAAAMATSTE
jgi:stearoyl-CoA desaturase (Delta-9 desaturase)